MNLLHRTRAFVVLMALVAASSATSCESSRSTAPPPEDLAETQEAVVHYPCDTDPAHPYSHNCFTHPGTCCGRTDDSNSTYECVTDFTTDPDYCGGCGVETKCPPRANAARTCVSSTCGFTCNSGYADCNGLSTDGCEVFLSTDSAHCGGCNNPCGSGEVCINGQCELRDCASAPAGSPCTDGDFCKGIGTCSSLGACVFGTPPAIDDGNPQTLDTCDPSTGFINHVLVPPLDTTVASTVHKVTSFIPVGDYPLQVGLDPATLDPQRVAMIRGKITVGGSAIVGATISVLGHSEYGHTLSQTTGKFDLVVNGGGPLTIVVQRVGYLPLRRQVEVPWQQYLVLPDIGLTARDRAVAVDVSAGGSIQGSTITEGTVQRRATLIFQSSTSATADGAPLPPNLAIRASEYTVGAGGPSQMPADLPAASAYTYAVEYGVDQAEGASQVNFTKPVFAYVDNFLSFPVGTRVPVGYLDKQKNAWVPSADGQVIKIVSVTGCPGPSCIADVDTDGVGGADNTGMATEERQKLASLYGAGAELWRVQIDHFSTWDFNFPFKWPSDAIAPLDALKDLLSTGKDGTPCTAHGSIIECENQILGEQFPITGTPFNLAYWSDRTPGRKAAYRLSAHVVPSSSVPASLKRVEVELHVAGQVIKDTVTCSPTCTPGATSTVEWDGKDAYGRLVQGRQQALMRIGYVYDGTYQQANAGGFGQPGNGVDVTADFTRQEITLWSSWQGLIGTWLAAEEKLGGFTISAHHRYDPVGKTVFFGDGGEKAATTLGQTISTYAGVSPTLNVPSHVAVASDGTVYVAETNGHRVRSIAPGGTVTTILGTGTTGLGLNQVSFPHGLAIGPDDSLYIADTGDGVSDTMGNRILQWKDGLVTVVAGTGTWNHTGDNGPATAATMRSPWGVAVAGDGTIFIAESGSGCVRRVGPEGNISTFAGTGATGASGDNGLAKNAAIGNPVAVALAKDGSVYVTQQSDHRIRRIRPNGVIETFAGNGTPAYGGDGGVATAASFNQPEGLAVGQDGSLFIADGLNYRVRRVDPSGKISTVVGAGPPGGSSGDGGPATAAQLNWPRGVAIAPDGALFVGDAGLVRRVAPTLQGYTSVGDIVVSSDDGSLLFTFWPDGRHMRTQHAITGTVLLSFAYDANGLLHTITDESNNVTTIQRDGSGQAFRIDSSVGKQTGLAVYTTGAGAGYLQSITNPASEAVQFTSYASGGLLTALLDPLGQQHTFTYDAAGFGRLATDTAPTASGAKKTLTRTDNGASYSVAVASAFAAGVDLTTTHKLTFLDDGSVEKRATGPDSLEVVALSKADGSSTTHYPDGSTLTVQREGDPRFGMQAPVVSEIQLATGGKTLAIETTRTTDPPAPTNPLAINSLTETQGIVGQVPFTTSYDTSLKKVTYHTPTGRESYAQLDTNSRLSEVWAKSLAKVTLQYDGSGRVSVITHKHPTNTALDRVYHVFYRTDDGQVDYVQEPYSAHLAAFGYDAATRVTSVTQPGVGGNRLTTLTYDHNGNVNLLTPPGKTAHDFDPTTIDLISKYTPPSAGLSFPATSYTYMRDGQLDVTTLPNGTAGGAPVDVSYDGSGRVSGLSTSDSSGLHASFGLTSFTYEAPSHPTMPGKLTRIDGPVTGAYMTFAYAGMLPTDDVTAGLISGANITVHRDFDNDLRVSHETVNGAWPVAFGYDDDGELQSAGAMTITRHPDHGLVTGTDLTGTTTLTGTHHLTDQMTYTPFGEPLVYSATWDTSSPVFTIDCSSSTAYDKRGRLLTKTETINGVAHTYAYTYDAADRLYQYTKDGTLQATYTYDANGNRSGTGWSVDAQDRLSTSPSYTYTYTHNGELRTRVTGTQVTTYTYDLLGNLRSVALPSASTITYDVDALGRRVKKTVSGTVEHAWAWDGNRIVAELDASGIVKARFIYATNSNVPDYIVKQGKGGNPTYRILKDHLGSVRAVVNVGSGTIVQQIDYDPWGKVLSDTSPKFQPFGFAGGQYDPDTGLVRFGARDYDPSTGRWTSKDPGRFSGGMNLYAYAYNDPINYVDVDGRNPAVIAGVAKFGIGFAAGFATTAGWTAISKGGFSNLTSQDWKNATVAGFFGGVNAVLPASTRLGAAAWGALSNGLQFMATNNCGSDPVTYLIRGGWSVALGGLGGYVGAVAQGLPSVAPQGLKEIPVPFVVWHQVGLGSVFRGSGYSSIIGNLPL